MLLWLSSQWNLKNKQSATLNFFSLFLLKANNENWKNEHSACTFLRVSLPSHFPLFSSFLYFSKNSKRIINLFHRAILQHVDDYQFLIRSRTNWVCGFPIPLTLHFHFLQFLETQKGKKITYQATVFDVQQFPVTKGQRLNYYPKKKHHRCSKKELQWHRVVSYRLVHENQGFERKLETVDPWSEVCGIGIKPRRIMLSILYAVSFMYVMFCVFVWPAEIF